MKQFDLFTLRKRRVVDLLAISPKVRRAYIWEKLTGYSERQAKREQARKRKQPRESKQEGLFD